MKSLLSLRSVLLDAFLPALLATITAPAAELHVPNQYPSIQEAVNASSSGDTIRLAGGDYMEQVVIADKTDLTLIAEPGAILHAINGMTETLPGSANVFFPVLGILRSSVKVDGLIVDGNNLGDLYDAAGRLLGIYFLGSSGQITNCTIRRFRDAMANGIHIYNLTNLATPPINVDILNSTFADNIISIQLRGDPSGANARLLRTSFLVEENTFTGLGLSATNPHWGIFIRNGAAGEVRGNTFTDFGFAQGDNPASTGWSAGIIGQDGASRTPPRFAPLLPVRFENNTFSNNNEHLRLFTGNDSQIINNIFRGTDPSGPVYGGVGLSGTNITVANNNFSDMPTAIVLFGPDTILTNAPAMSPTSDPTLTDNWFCRVSQPVSTRPGATGLQEQATKTCEEASFRPMFQSISGRDATPLASASFALRSWHGQPVIIESSTNLQQWVPVHTNAMTLPSFKFEAPAASATSRQFYRARQQ